MQIVAEIKTGYDDVREVRDKTTQEIRMLKQEAYIDLGGAYPVRCKITVGERLSPGKYHLQLPMKVGRFGDPEINPFEPVTVVKSISDADRKTA